MGWGKALTVEGAFRREYGRSTYDYVSVLIQGGMAREDAYAMLHGAVDAVWRRVKLNYNAVRG